MANVTQSFDVHRQRSNIRVLKEGIGVVGLHDVHCCYCRLIAAAGAAVAAGIVVALVVAVAFGGRCSTICRMFSLHCLVCFSTFLLHHFSPSASSARPWVSSTLSSSRACLVALLAARQTLRLPLALRMLDPSSIRTHHSFLHHVMYLFGTSLPSCAEFLVSSTLFSPTHSSCVFPCPSSLSCSSRAFTSLLLFFL